ncbi:Irc22p KNAG_0L00880 [Huiozyma naganishii CBS 8797]|uniref:Increased recombination centers protein 22 n=1 Tax=Huiozyma naganishii (strain ATCC MYA-139 / BCRC 22969 / CBS 8797 / KCTC 17520 / NBRC 10181 / NCYC 3082 / Yp74L-3) TaxID=1071383 RepID=J7SAF5_HUIN7|nr:hypothetical protein KNAG_0L00880 [Kazachstania naganishii CBS 8797]CCK72709.1 hypothetical protein KNAG_0L00880 [Kazachstania naganishii CBS 8797]
MKLNRFICWAWLAAVSAVNAQSDDVEGLSDSSDVVIDETVVPSSADFGEEDAATPETPPTVQLNITYTVMDREPVPMGEFMPMDHDEVFVLNYTLTNKESFPISVAGVSGNILEYPSGDLVTSISFGELTDLYVPVNDTIAFRQKIAFDLEPGNYYLFPLVHVINEDAKKQEPAEGETDGESAFTVASSPTLMSVAEPIMSVFDPYFLSIQVLFLSMVGAVSYYFMYRKNGKKLNERIQPVKRDPKEWLPEQYKK